MNLSRLRTLLEQGYSFETCRAVLAETALLYREPTASRWYFLLLNRVFCQIIENPDFIEADIVDPILESLFSAARLGLDAAEREDTDTLVVSAMQLTETYTAFP